MKSINLLRELGCLDGDADHTKVYPSIPANRLEEFMQAVNRFVYAHPVSVD